MTRCDVVRTSRICVLRRLQYIELQHALRSAALFHVLERHIIAARRSSATLELGLDEATECQDIAVRLSRIDPFFTLELNTINGANSISTLVNTEAKQISTVKNATRMTSTDTP